MVDSGIEALAAEVRRWIAADPDPETRAEAARLLEAAAGGDPDAESRLRDAFRGRLAFGTAGLRARLGAGPRRMNRVVVAQSSAGLAAFLLERAARGEAADPPLVVVGYDARVNSEVFARDTAEVLAGAGVRVKLFPAPVPTPVTAFAVRHERASAGVMITASHNPPRDNGYKVYLGDADGGSQVVSPTDREIAARIATATRPFDEIARGAGVEFVGPEVEAAYVEQVAAAVRSNGGSPEPAGDEGASPLPVYTAMHGVGAAPLRRVFAAAGLPDPIAVPEQEQPDGAFPTLKYPNPEESSALELAYRHAARHGAEIVIANDPDADRLGIAARHPDEPGDDGVAAGFRRLTGNEIGLLLGWRAARLAREQGRDGVLASTIVSSPALGAVARHYGFAHVETLSGSKWLSRVPRLIFGYEEALGYLVHPDVVGDKDGIGAAAEMIALAQECRRGSGTLWSLLGEASMLFGHFASRQIVVRYEHADEALATSERVRVRPPAAFERFPVTRVRDFRERGLAAATTNLLAYDLEDGSRVMIRPSGTEPKLKVYIDAFSGTGSLADRRAETGRALDDIEAAVQIALDGLGS